MTMNKSFYNFENFEVRGLFSNSFQTKLSNEAGT
jgi:hypothetical protein